MSEQEAPAFRIERNGAVAVLSFQRPRSGNAIPSPAIPDLTAALERVRADTSVGALLVRGDGPNFSAGGDLNGFARALEHPPEERRVEFRARLARVATLAELFLSLDLPIVVACRGGVAGAGMMYALGADVVLVDDSVRFVFAQQRVGLSPDGAISYLLPRIVGDRRARELVLTAGSVDAAEAVRIGLASRIVAVDALEEDAMGQATRLAASSRVAIREAKGLLRHSLDRDAAAQLEAEAAAIVACVGEDDFAEGVGALLDKRPPAFPSAAAGKSLTRSEHAN